MHLINETHIEQFRKIVGEAYVFTEDEVLSKYGTDQTERLFFMPQVVIKPRSAEEISEILKICNQYQIPVTPRGGGTGLSGGALPVNGGVVLATERMNTILNIDEKNLQVLTEPGVNTEVLQDAVKEKDLFFPPDPASKGSCFIEGNIAENSGGPKAVKYGVVKDYVLNLEVVLPTGEIIWTGANTLKNVTGYNLTQLIVGSEGTLGIVTKIVLKLIPFPKHDLTMFATFTTLERACEAVNLILMKGFNPCGLELMEMDALKMAASRTPHQLPIHDNLAACLIIEVDGNNADRLMNEIECMAQLLEELEPA
ncbi:MAG TPA: FAD-binding protein, partial [Niabella sp.]|nr:FAD-binding protein [Niabella sp.]